MALIETAKGWDIPYSLLLDLKAGWCPFCGPEHSKVKQIGHYTWECENCWETFVYTGQE